MSQSKAKKLTHAKKDQRRPAGSNLAVYLVLGGMVLVAAALFAVWKSGQPETASVPVEVKGQPSLKVDQERLDFGDVKLGQTVTASFTLFNAGDQTLRITGKPTIQVLEGC
jgi:HYDIN/CFA65/VesB-like, Ig-like domain